MWISFWRGKWGGRGPRAELQQSRGLAENVSAPETVCARDGGRLLSHTTQPLTGGHISAGGSMQDSSPSLCPTPAPKGSECSRHRTLLPALCISPFLSVSGAFCGSYAALAPWQSFEEPRCDLRENLLRSGCGEANIVYTRGVMETKQVCAGDTAPAQPLLRGLSCPSSFSRLLSRKNTKPRLLFM